MGSPLSDLKEALRATIQSAISKNVTHLQMFFRYQTLIMTINEKLHLELSFFYFSWDENGQAGALAEFILKKPNHVMDQPTC
ncbi:unnamed protein product [Eruca vesicaria subsp. sativa]|uniref:Uncharacterized protein n=1 Tax=Eruca vesicaria subsp. sativa TaxID=29727 RepID=A0ABC8JRW2_ERUVS|nr:unnamed protein product [Eruca vesicaria subsp. sativa]